MHWPTLLHSWLPFQEFDVYVVGAQECQSEIVASLHSPEKSEWEAKIRGTIGSKYSMVASETMGAFMVAARAFFCICIVESECAVALFCVLLCLCLSHAISGAVHIAAFVSKRLLPYVKSVETASVKTGFNGTVSNKGCCALSFTLGSTSFLFCSAHLEAHAHNVAARNDGWSRIESELCKRLSKCRGKPQATMVSECFDRVVFMGDLNYRVAEEYKVVCEAIARNDMAYLLGLDQLRQVTCSTFQFFHVTDNQQEMINKSVFTEYLEHPITFPPTYKFDINSDDYDSSKKARTPSWTDRILFKSNSDLAWDCLHYSSVAPIKSSDHRPVHAIFNSVKAHLLLVFSLLDSQRSRCSLMKLRISPKLHQIQNQALHVFCNSPFFIQVFTLVHSQ